MVLFTGHIIRYTWRKIFYNANILWLMWQQLKKPVLPFWRQNNHQNLAFVCWPTVNFMQIKMDKFTFHFFISILKLAIWHAYALSCFHICVSEQEYLKIWPISISSAAAFHVFSEYVCMQVLCVWEWRVAVCLRYSEVEWQVILRLRFMWGLLYRGKSGQTQHQNNHHDWVDWQHAPE